jgi:hypothetical protein
MMSGVPKLTTKSEWELSSHSRVDYGRSPHTYVNQRLQIPLELLIMSGVPFETCWAFNERWNNKFYYKVASCWLFLLNRTDNSLHPICSSPHGWRPSLRINISLYATSWSVGVRYKLIPTVSERKNNLKIRVPPKHRHCFRRLQGITLQKTAIFRFLDARNSNIRFPCFLEIGNFRGWCD